MSDHENNASDAGANTEAIQVGDDPSALGGRSLDSLTTLATELSNVQDPPARAINLDDLPLFGSIPRNVGPNYGTSAERNNGRLRCLVPTTPASRRAKGALLRVLEVTYDELQDRLGAVLTIKPYVDRRMARLNAETARLTALSDHLFARRVETKSQIARILGQHLAAAAEAEGAEMEEVVDEDLWGQLLLLSSLMEQDADWHDMGDENLVLVRETRPWKKWLDKEEEEITEQLGWYREVIARLSGEVEMDALRV